MKVGEFINKIIYGKHFNSWNYDESLPFEELEESGYPYSMVCIEFNENSILAVSTGNDSPSDFIEKNQSTQFVIDAKKHPRKIEESMLGVKNVFYAKKLKNKKIKTENRWSQFTINVFKEDGKIFAAAGNGSFSPMIIHEAFTQIVNKLKSIKKDTETKENFLEAEIGSTFIKVDFLNEEPYYKTSIKSRGLTYNEIKFVVNQFMRV